MLEGHFDANGYALHLAGWASPSRLSALGTALPGFGEGLVKVLPANHSAAPAPIDLTATRPWHGMQVWTEASARPVIRHSHRAR